MVAFGSMIVKLSASAALTFWALCGLVNTDETTDMHIH